MDQVIVLWKKRIRFSVKKQLKIKWGFPYLIIDVLVDIFWRTAIDSWNPKDIHSLGYENTNFLKSSKHCGNVSVTVWQTKEAPIIFIKRMMQEFFLVYNKKTLQYTNRKYVYNHIVSEEQQRKICPIWHDKDCKIRKYYIKFINCLSALHNKRYVILKLSYYVFSRCVLYFMSLQEKRIDFFLKKNLNFIWTQSKTHF